MTDDDIKRLNQISENLQSSLIILDEIMHPPIQHGRVESATIAPLEGSSDALRKKVADTIKSLGFRFGATSEKELIGVNPDLVKCVRSALDLTTQDFMVFDGRRTATEQAQHVANGTSKTMDSKHINGFAVDLVPWIDGKPKWDWEGCYKIADAMMLAASSFGFQNRITWGGVWDKTMQEIWESTPGNIHGLEVWRRAVREYGVRHPGPDFIDGPHFEIKP